MMNKKQVEQRVKELFRQNRYNKVWAQDNADYWQAFADKTPLKGAKKNAQRWADAYKALIS